MQHLPVSTTSRRPGALYAPDSSSAAAGSLPDAASAQGAAAAPSMAAAAAAAASENRPRPEAQPLSNLRVSLMPSDLEGRPAPNLGKGLVLLGIVLAAETVAIGLLYFGASRYVNGKLAQREQLIAQIGTLEAEAKAMEPGAQTAVAYYFQLINGRQVLDSHIYWTQFFAFLEKNTLPSVQYLSFSGDISSGTISIDAVGRTYRDVARQIISLREHPMVLEVRSTGAAARLSPTGEVQGVSFGMTVRLKPELWRKVAAPAATTEQPAVPTDSGIVPAPTTPTTVPTAPTDTVTTGTDAAGNPVTVIGGQPAAPAPTETPPPDAATPPTP